MKTKKSYAKRLKVSKNGKITARNKGQNHFNAKESRRAQLAKRRTTPFVMSNKSKSRFLSGLTNR
jgi:ribosomal protein L35